MMKKAAIIVLSSLTSCCHQLRKSPYLTLTAHRGRERVTYQRSPP